MDDIITVPQSPSGVPPTEEDVRQELDAYFSVLHGIEMIMDVNGLMAALYESHWSTLQWLRARAGLPVIPREGRIDFLNNDEPGKENWREFRTRLLEQAGIPDRSKSAALRKLLDELLDD